MVLVGTLGMWLMNIFVVALITGQVMDQIFCDDEEEEEEVEDDDEEDDRLEGKHVK